MQFYKGTSVVRNIEHGIGTEINADSVGQGLLEHENIKI